MTETVKMTGGGAVVNPSARLPRNVGSCAQGCVKSTLSVPGAQSRCSAGLGLRIAHNGFGGSQMFKPCSTQNLTLIWAQCGDLCMDLSRLCVAFGIPFGSFRFCDAVSQWSHANTSSRCREKSLPHLDTDPCLCHKSKDVFEFCNLWQVHFTTSQYTLPNVFM
jgi:hypothetical protein